METLLWTLGLGLGLSLATLAAIGLAWLRPWIDDWAEDAKLIGD